MMRFVLLCMVFLAFAGGINAQDDCGRGLPCGPVPWALPNYPPLITPTAFTSGFVLTPTATPSPTATPTKTPTFTPEPHVTATAFFDLDFIGDNVATASALIEGTQVPVLDGEGNELEFAGNAGVFFSYAKGLATGDTFGVYTPFILIILSLLALSFTFAMLSFTLPFAALILGLMVKAITLIIKAIRG